MENSKYIITTVALIALIVAAGIFLNRQFNFVHYFMPSSGSSTLNEFYSLKEEANFRTAMANVHVVRSALASYAASTEMLLYPIGEYNYEQLREILPEPNPLHLPKSLKEAKWVEGSFLYSSKTGETFTITVKVHNEHQDLITGTPSRVEPSDYPR